MRSNGEIELLHGLSVMDSEPIGPRINANKSIHAVLRILTFRRHASLVGQCCGPLD